jgi:hypothetical protein
MIEMAIIPSGRMAIRPNEHTWEFKQKPESS